MTGSSSLTDVVGGRLVCFHCPVGGGGVGGRERVVVGEGSAGARPSSFVPASVAAAHR